MKAAMKKELIAIKNRCADDLASIQNLLGEEESYACDLESETKLEESEERQEALGEIGELLETTLTALEELIA